MPSGWQNLAMYSGWQNLAMYLGIFVQLKYKIRSVRYGLDSSEEVELDKVAFLIAGS